MIGFYPGNSSQQTHSPQFQAGIIARIPIHSKRLEAKGIHFPDATRMKTLKDIVARATRGNAKGHAIIRKKQHSDGLTAAIIDTTVASHATPKQIKRQMTVTDFIIRELKKKGIGHFLFHQVFQK
jgi:hypothetical protein